jgi:hypothetical protein
MLNELFAAKHYQLVMHGVMPKTSNIINLQEPIGAFFVQPSLNSGSV